MQCTLFIKYVNSTVKALFNDVCFTVAKRMLAKREVMFRGSSLDVLPYDPMPSPNIDPCRTIVVNGITSKIDKDDLIDYFENNNMSGGGEVEIMDLKLGLELAYITFVLQEGITSKMKYLATNFIFSSSSHSFFCYIKGSVVA